MFSALLDLILSELGDFILLSALGWGTVPVAKEAYAKYGHTLLFEKDPKGDGKPFEFDRSYTRVAADLLSQASKIALLVSGADCIDAMLSALDPPKAEGDEGEGHEHQSFIARIDIGLVLAKVAYTVWFANRAMALKQYLLGLASEKVPDKVNLGKAQIYDRLGNAFLSFMAFVFLVDAMEADVGAGLTSIFATAGMGTLVFGIASKDLAAQLVGGLFLSLSDKFYQGDTIRLGDGTSGVVVKISWFHTILRGGDEVNTKIPNSQIANMRVSNLSRAQTCQVKQLLYFSHSDASKMPSLIAKIRKEIAVACGDNLINNGTRPFRVIWTDYVPDGRIEVLVDCRFRIKPLGDPYWNNRAKVLEAMRVAMEECGLEPSAPARRELSELLARKVVNEMDVSESDSGLAS